MVQQALEFCGQYTREHEQTQAFSKALIDNGLLVERNATVRTPDGREFNLNGFLVVDVEKFVALPEATVVEWHRSGWLALIHQHLMSLGRFNDLTRRRSSARRPDQLEGTASALREPCHCCNPCSSRHASTQSGVACCPNSHRAAAVPAWSIARHICNVPCRRCA